MVPESQVTETATKFGERVDGIATKKVVLIDKKKRTIPLKDSLERTRNTRFSCQIGNYELQEGMKRKLC